MPLRPNSSPFQWTASPRPALLASSPRDKITSALDVALQAPASVIRNRSVQRRMAWLFVSQDWAAVLEPERSARRDATEAPRGHDGIASQGCVYAGRCQHHLEICAAAAPQGHGCGPEHRAAGYLLGWPRPAPTGSDSATRESWLHVELTKWSFRCHMFDKPAT